MDSLPFPFWILVARGNTPWQPVMLAPGQIAAFSTIGKAGEFLADAAKPDWEVRLVVRPTLLELLDGFRVRGANGFALDPTSSEPGTPIAFDGPEGPFTANEA